jgi:uncharacterized membrane protein YgdD (TMEM256/DUF423 family)
MLSSCLSILAPTAAAAFFSLASPVCAQVAGHSSSGAMQSLTLTGVATGLTIPPGTTLATICVEVAAARYRDDGGAPTASVGLPLAIGACMNYSGPLAALQFIAQSGSPVLTAAYYR